ncbi:methyltransferase domain-containing protein [Salinarimonas sp.]|uniref:protein-L-isoaspartate O-methyltransferase family protein n=1 Tax=Salinarimonas sp. TaxID=2766526 RepID=UPI0032D8C1EF
MTSLPPLPATPEELAFLRRAYAHQVCHRAEVSDPRVAAAFARVAREAFLGPPPWRLIQEHGRVREIPEPDPALAYQDALFALAPKLFLNNGQPSLHARLLDALGLFEGARVAHLGAGTGYYTAIVAELVGPSGHVLAVEHEARLAADAREALAPWPQVEVVHGDGLATDLDGVEAIYVSFAVEDYPPPWRAAIAAGARLLAPLGARALVDGAPGPWAAGAAFLIAPDAEGVAARYVSPARFVCAQGAEPVSPDHRARLARAFAEGRPSQVRGFVLGPAGERDVFFATPEWALVC